MSSPLPNFTDLSDLHKCANNLLHSPHIQQALHHHHHHHHETMSSIRDISEASLKMLDMCGATRESHSLIKQLLKDVQHSLRRAHIEGFDFEARISAHELHDKKVKKKVIQCLRATKGMKSKYFTSDLSLIDPSLIVVVHVLRELRGATISILESLLSIVILPYCIRNVGHKITQSRSFASKLRRINCQKLLERCDTLDVEVENKRLEEVSSSMEDLEVELESIIRRLMRTRVLLLNLLTS